jgi:hypothetical protein
MTTINKNRFAGAAFDDSDDEPAKVTVTKTQKKKEERKITERPVKVNTSKMAEGGFEVTDAGRAPARGGRGGDSRGGRGGRGRGGDGEGRGGRGRGDRPRTAAVRTDADGNPIA